jgi:DHA1 family bicyclomycin/chloramphenicol resistance-like MFS transporter
MYTLYKKFNSDYVYRNKCVVVFIVTLASILESIICTIFIPSTKSIAHSFNISIQEAERSFTWYNNALFFSAPFYGIFGSFLGRRTLMVIGSLLLFLGSLIPIFFLHSNVFFIARLLQGFGACAAGAVGWASIQDIFDLKKSASIMSLMGAIITLVPLCAPLLGGYIDITYSWTVLLKLVSLLTLLYLIFTLFLFPETKIDKKIDISIKESIVNSIIQYKFILFNNKFIVPSLIFSFSYICEWLFISFFTVYYYEYQSSSPECLGFYFSILMLFYVIGASIANVMLKKKNIFYIINFSVNLMIIICFIRVVYDSIFEFNIIVCLIFQSLFLLSSGMIFGPSSAIALKSFPNFTSVTSSLRTTLLMLGGAIGAWLGSIISLMPIIVFSGLCLFFILIVKILTKLNYELNTSIAE